MFDYDAIIVGSGPAGLTAGIYLGRAGYRVLIIEKDAFGGQLNQISMIENYPGFVDGIAGPQLAAEMLGQAMKYGAEIEQGEVTGIESGPDLRTVSCGDGRRFTCRVVIIAGGSRPRDMGVPGEDALKGKGLIHCALCDGGQFAGGVVAVCGGGDAGISEALYLANLPASVVLIEAMPALTATAVLQERVHSDGRIEVCCGTKVVRIVGDEKVEAIELKDAESGNTETRTVDGVLVHIGIEPNTGYLRDVLSLDGEGQIVVNERFETAASYILAAGDIRSGSPRQVVTAVGDGAAAAITAQRLLQIPGKQ
ncbi:MAG: Thioredoxin reductase [Syntrophorhabdus sp. PtaU1.Bin058]|nr:MAG: Thioredoxin reductase [Syntrophorhabdus sp. PtaU1.Bin058]